MFGLLEKDIRLAAQRKKALGLFLVVMAIMGFSTDGVFIVSYGTMLMGIFTAGTLSYDEFDNCFPFLMTLPITKKDYATEKFIFCGAGVLLGWVASMIVCAVIASVQGNLHLMIEQWAEEIVLFPMFFAIISIMIPLQLKYDVEKSRIVLLIMGGAVFGLSAIGSAMKDKITIFKVIDALPDMVIFVGFLVVSVAIITAMYKLSIKVLENKEF